MVNIHLNISNNSVLFLSVPIDDIRRLSLYPLKWLRFVTFTICGARGELHATPGGPVVNYNTSFVNIADDSDYHYYHQGNFIFIDSNGTSSRHTSSKRTSRRNDFRASVIERDGDRCVITRASSRACDAAHIIPRCKGEEYIARVIQDRSVLYPIFPVFGIDAVENGILLRKDLHADFGNGDVAFLMTPNFALQPNDIPRVEQGPTPSIRTTLQYITPPDSRATVPAYDTQCSGTGQQMPPSLILDYFYGVAAYKRWKRGLEGELALEGYYLEHYKSIPPFPGTHDDTLPDDDSRDPDYDPRTPPTHNPHRFDTMVQAMDDMNFHIMGLRGITPQEWTAQQQEKEKEEQNASRNKVLEWIENIPSSPKESPVYHF